MPRGAARRALLGAAVAVTSCAAVVACGSDSEAEPVTLTRSTIEWETYDYELSRFQTILGDSFDGERRTVRSFDTLVLANEFVEVTLVPEFGGRILSIVYLPTGHEQLYQNPVGVPYQIGTGVFYHDWLMVWGGIFPTFPEPEHGKAWFLPWDVEVVEESDDVVSVAMTFSDDDDHQFVPSQYDGDATGLQVTYTVTLAAGRSALDTSVAIVNPGNEAVEYEYWTNVTLAPGSSPGDPRATADTEIIAPVEQIQIPGYWEAIAAQEEATGLFEIHRFENLRRFGDWSDRGIAYAFPDVGGVDHWGAINHDAGEGLFRIADNSVTPGLKLWTWGYEQSVDVDPWSGPVEERPYIEMWAGVTPQFFMSTEVEPGDVVAFDETYGTSVGLTNVTHASPDVLADVGVDGDMLHAELFGFTPGREVGVSVTVDGEVVHDADVTFDALAPTVISARLPDGAGDTTIDIVVTDGETALLDIRLDPS